MPTLSLLYNYDIDRDASAGLVIARCVECGPDEDDPTKYQAWRTPTFAASTVVQGNVTVGLWSAMKDFDTKQGAISVYLRDFDGSDYVELGGVTHTDPSWPGGWVLKTLQVSISSHTLAPGHCLELKVVVEDSSDDDMWFAYDTNDRKSSVNLPH